METYAYGFPRIGKDREYKKFIEGYWNREFSEEDLRSQVDALQNEMLSTYGRFVHKFPIGEMTFYDNMLDTAIMVGVYEVKDLEGYYNLCRGKNALAMKKWFNTNYHYLIPDFSGMENPSFTLTWNKPKESLEKHRKGIPHLLGPFTFLKLSNGVDDSTFSRHLMSLGVVYREAIKDFDEVHIEEPAFVMDISEGEREAIKEVYKLMHIDGVNINIFTYYDSVDFLEDLYGLPVKAIGLDFVNGKENFRDIERYGFPDDKILVAGLISGLNVWRADIETVVGQAKRLSKVAKQMVVSNAGPLYHLPITTKGERFDQRLLGSLAFAEEKLYEINLVSQCYEGREIKQWYIPYISEENAGVKKRVDDIDKKAFIKATPYHERAQRQKKKLNLPLFPTTTIGSFPQTADIRKKRADFKAGQISKTEYSAFIKERISELINIQEDLGLDVLVHGEFERSDMVEFFAERLDGIVTTQKGWISSYGTRAYRPPIICGDIVRNQPMTIDEVVFAQSLTKKPVKGILTGPVTIIAWSFIREDIPISQIAYQIALCLQDEIRDYEKQNIKIVQIDEPAFRELAPIKKRRWDEYFDWAVNAFNLASQSNPETQIHTHMCYSEFGAIIEWIAKMDFDVITIETAREKGDGVKDFERVAFKKQIGPGVWDVHSPVVPSMEDMETVIRHVLQFLLPQNLWINPDCGLKTRGWAEVKESLKNMVALARRLRKGGQASD